MLVLDAAPSTAESFALLAMLAAHVQAIGPWVRIGGYWGWCGRLQPQLGGNLWRRARLAAGLGEFTLHDLRPFFASG